MLRALVVEIEKLRHASLPLWSVAVVALSPSLSNVFTRASEPDISWSGFLTLGAMTMGTWYGILLFGVITAYVFGREYEEGVAPNLFTSSVRREQFVVAKFIVIGAWILVLVLLAVVAQVAWATVLGLAGTEWSHVWSLLADLLKVAGLIYLTLPMVALISVVSRGIFAPMIWSAFGFTAGMIGGPAGWGDWLPWAMPTAIGGTFLGPVASTFVAELTPTSWIIDVGLFGASMAALIWWVNHADSRP